MPQDHRVHRGVLWSLIRAQLKVGSMGFGGPLATMAFMRDELVDREKLVTNDRYLEGLAVVKLLPGPVSMLLSVFLGQQVGGVWGGFFSGVAYMLPSFLLLLGVAWAQDRLPPGILDSTAFLSTMKGVQVSVISVVLFTCWKLFRESWQRSYAGKRRSGVVGGVALLAFLMSVMHVSELLVLLGAALMGVTALKFQKTSQESPRLRVDLMILFWVFFTAGLTVFGTGYMVLPHLQRVLVHKNAWLTSKDFLDAVAWGNLTPGPIVIASTYMGYRIAAWGGAVVATVGIFAGPILLMLSLGPVLKRVLGRPWVEGVLLGVIPAVATVITAGLLPLAQALEWSAASVSLAVLVFVLSLRGWSVVKLFGVGAVIGATLLRMLEFR